MYMKVTKDMFFDEFRSYDKYHDFTDAGIEALFEYIEDVEKHSGIPVMLEPFAILEMYREFHEYKSLREAAKDYSDIIKDIENNPIALEDYTTVINVFENAHVLVKRF